MHGDGFCSYLAAYKEDGVNMDSKIEFRSDLERSPAEPSSHLRPASPALASVLLF